MNISLCTKSDWEHPAENPNRLKLLKDIAAIFRDCLRNPSSLDDAKITVARSSSGPLHSKTSFTPRESVIYIDSHPRDWCKHVYQFAHEFIHFLAESESKASDGRHYHNLWFEETLCEVGSLFALREYDEKSDGRVQHTENDYRDYLTRIAKCPGRVWNSDSLEDWLRRNRDVLVKTRINDENTARPLQWQAADKLLPLFTSNPIGWNAVLTLNTDPDQRASIPFEKYLLNWFHSAPNCDKGFIRSIALDFGVNIT